MKCEVIIEENSCEKVVIYAKKRTQLVDMIEKLCADDDLVLMGYKDKQTFVLDPLQINCFMVESDKVYAICDEGRYQIKARLYQIEEQLSDNFIKINQSCVANIKKIKRFDASVSGVLIVYFQSGYRDYVSRRNLKNVKQKLGL